MTNPRSPRPDTPSFRRIQVSDHAVPGCYRRRTPPVVTVRSAIQKGSNPDSKSCAITRVIAQRSSSDTTPTDDASRDMAGRRRRRSHRGRDRHFRRGSHRPNDRGNPASTGAMARLRPHIHQSHLSRSFPCGGSPSYLGQHPGNRLPLRTSPPSPGPRAETRE